MNDQKSTRTYDEITPTMRAFIGTREVLRRIGYRSEDLYCMIANSMKLGGKLGAFCVLRTQGKEFLIDLGECSESFGDEYKVMAHIINSGGISKDDADRMVNECEARRHVVDVMSAIKAKGILLPSELLGAGRR